MKIKQLFDSNKDIYRTIEKVITYSASQEQRLNAEISEYVVTESIEEQFEKLLGKMQAAMEADGENEVGVWVSGFYGSGKSSFTKYLGTKNKEIPFTPSGASGSRARTICIMFSDKSCSPHVINIFWPGHV